MDQDPNIEIVWRLKKSLYFYIEDMAAVEAKKEVT